MPSAPSPSPVWARVKWFNQGKGFGFVIPGETLPEAFIHASVLSGSGNPPLEEGAEILCDIALTAKGPQVARVHQVLPPPPVEEPPPDREGQVKWYQPEKGFGFLMVGDGERDVFVHRTALRRSGLESLEPGQRVRVAVRPTAKGREAWRVIPCS